MLTPLASTVEIAKMELRKQEDDKTECTNICVEELATS